MAGEGFLMAWVVGVSPESVVWMMEPLGVVIESEAKPAARKLG